MTPAESHQLAELTVRLFGEDGQGGSLGRIEHKLDQQDGRIGALERDRIAREAVAAAGTRLDQVRRDTTRWRITAMVSVTGLGVSAFVGMANLFGWFGTG